MLSAYQYPTHELRKIAFAVRNPGMRAGPAVTGFGGGRGMGRGRSGDHGGGPRGPPGGGMVPTPMGMMPAQMAMQMGMSNPTGVFPGGMGGMDPMMMNMPMEAMGQMVRSHLCLPVSNSALQQLNDGTGASKT